MKNKRNKTNKIIAVLYYLTAICFYATMIMYFISKDNNNAVVFLCLGSVFVCLGSVYLKKDKKRKDKENKVQFR